MKKSILSLILAAGVIMPAAAQVPVDTFETYANTAALDAAWTNQAGSTQLQVTAGDGASGSNNFVRYTSAAERRYWAGTFSVTPTDASPATMEYYHRQPLGATLNREYINVNSSLTGVDIVAVGNYNSSTGTQFFGRVNGGGGPSWGTIGGTRLDNTWQHLEARIKTRDVDFYVDGVKTATQSRTTADHPAYTVLFMGSNLTSNGDVDMDNVGFTQVASVPDWDLY